MQAEQTHIDWFQVVTDLVRHGYSLSSIATHINAPKSTLVGWKQGAEPRFCEGDRLLTFWCQITGRDRGQVPTVSIGDWWAYHAK